jgi:hypothetical protein
MYGDKVDISPDHQPVSALLRGEEIATVVRYNAKGQTCIDPVAVLRRNPHD